MIFYYCKGCNQVIYKLISEDKLLTCCGHKMEELKSNIEPNLRDEHLPVIRKTGNFVTVTVGNKHPMLDIHRISFIMIETNQGNMYKDTEHLEDAKASFILANQEEIVNIYVYCSVHRLWSLY